MQSTIPNHEKHSALELLSVIRERNKKHAITKKRHQNPKPVFLLATPPKFLMIQVEEKIIGQNL